MPRIARVSAGETVYHVINRSNGRVPIFKEDQEYQHFERLIEEAVEDRGMRILSYCIMPNHWHFALFPKRDGDMGEFMRWVTTTHVRQVRSQTDSIGHGHLYQGTYKSFPVQTDQHLQTLIQYIEQNPLRAKLVKQAEEWQWSSLWRRENGSVKAKKMLAELPIELPLNYLELVNSPFNTENLKTIRLSVNKGKPYGSEKWTDTMIEKYGLKSTTRGPGRPYKS